MSISVTLQATGSMRIARSVDEVRRIVAVSVEALCVSCLAVTGMIYTLRIQQHKPSRRARRPVTDEIASR